MIARSNRFHSENGNFQHGFVFFICPRTVSQKPTQGSIQSQWLRRRGKKGRVGSCPLSSNIFFFVEQLSKNSKLKKARLWKKANAKIKFGGFIKSVSEICSCLPLTPYFTDMYDAAGTEHGTFSPSP